MAKKAINRREFLSRTATTAFGATAFASLATASPTPAKPPRQRALRIAHLTDIHVQPEMNAAAGMARALQHAQNLPDKPGIKYLCNGVVCGNWWKGAYQEFPPAYVVVDLFDDGSSESEYIPY